MRRYRNSVLAIPAFAFLFALPLAAAAGFADVHHLITSGSPEQVSVSLHSDGGFTVAWVSADSNVDRSLYLQRFDAQGAASTTPTFVYYYSALALRRVATDAAGNDLVLWQILPGFPHAFDQFVAAAFPHLAGCCGARRRSRRSRESATRLLPASA